MPVTAVPLPRMPQDQNFHPIQVLGSMWPNKAGDVVASRIINLNDAIDIVTVLTQATDPAPADDIVLLLKPYHIYRLEAVGLALATNLTWLQLMFGDTADPVAGDFKVPPIAGAGIQGALWNLSWPVKDFVALPGQRRLAVKNMTAIVATVYVSLSELC